MREYIIDPITRKIKILKDESTIGVYNDKNVEEVQFSLTDENLAAELFGYNVYINYLAPNSGSVQQDQAGEKSYDAGNNKLTFSWLIGRSATQGVGKVIFIVCFQKVVDGEVEKEWNTTVASVSVLEGLEPELTEEEQELLASYYDTLVERLHEAGEAVIESIPQDYTALCEEVEDVKEGLAELDDRVEALEEGGGSGTGVPAEVKMAISALLDSAGYGETGVSDELAIVRAWATTTSSITLNASEITISGTGTNQLTATTVPSGNPVSWSSSNPNVATVSNTGLVTGVGNGSCVITASSGDVSETCSVVVSGFTMYTITNNLTNATNSNPATSIASGASYGASLTPASGYFLNAVTVTMGGVDITSTVYDSGNIEISSVTGDIVITVTTYKDTTAEIYKEYYMLAYQNSRIVELSITNGGITITYDMDAPSTVLYPAGVIPYKSQIFYSSQGEIQILKDGTPVSYVDITGRWAKAYNNSHTYTEFSNSWNASEYNQVRFSVDIRALDDAYMYDKTTGQVWFAGINTPYYGMCNISEANS